MSWTRELLAERPEIRPGKPHIRLHVVARWDKQRLWWHASVASIPWLRTTAEASVPIVLDRVRRLDD